jgi:hypothetical protein
MNRYIFAQNDSQRVANAIELLSIKLDTYGIGGNDFFKDGRLSST